MAISYVNVATWTSSTSPTTFTFNKPSGVQEGDVLIAFVCATSTGSVGAPSLSGWTAIYDGIGGFGSGNDTFSAAWWKVVDSADPSSWTSGSWTGGGLTANSVVVAYRGVNQSDPIVTHDSSVPGGMGTTPLTDNPAIVVEDVGGWVVNFMGYRSSASSTTSSHNLGFTERSDVSAGASSTFETVALYDSNGPYDVLGNVFCQVTSTQTAPSGGTWTAQLRPASGFPRLTEPELRAWTAASAVTASMSAGTMPTHRAGDLLLWGVTMTKSSGTITPTISVASGWNTLTSRASATGVHVTYLFYKFATSSSETAPTVSFTSGTSNGIVGQMMSWRYVDVVPTIFNGNNGTTSTTIASPSLTTTTDNCAIVRTAGVKDTSVTPTITWPAGTTLIDNENCATGSSVGTTGGRMTHSSAMGIQATAGATGTVNGTVSSGAPTSVAGLAVALSNSFRLSDDAASGTEASSLALTVPGADSGSGTDSARVVIAAADASSTTADNATKQVAGPNPGDDAGSGTDNAIGVKVTALADSGAGTDTATGVALSQIADTLGGADVARVQISGAADSSGTTADTGAVAANIPVSDSGAGVDTAFASNTAQVGDSGSGTDTARVVVYPTDSASAQDDILGRANDSILSDDSNFRVRVDLTDSASSSESATVTFNASVPDTGSATDTSRVALPQNDPGSASDASTVAAAIPVPDGLSGADNAAAKLAGIDSGSAADSAKVGFDQTDSGTATDTAKVVILGVDLGSAVDDSTSAVTWVVSDTASGVDNAVSFVTFGPVFGPRAIRIASEERVLLVEAEHRLRTADAETRLVFIGKELLIPKMNGSGFDISTESRVAKVKAETRVHLAPRDEE